MNAHVLELMVWHSTEDNLLSYISSATQHYIIRSVTDEHVSYVRCLLISLL